MNPVHVDADALRSVVSVQASAMEPEIPPLLLASVRRHQTNLVSLLESFRAAGIDEGQIEVAVTVVIDSYRNELLEAIRTLTTKPETAEEAR